MIPDRYHHATSYDGKRLIMLAAELDNTGAEVLALRVYDFGYRGSNVVTAAVVPFWVHVAILLGDCKAHGVQPSCRAQARLLAQNAASIGVSFVEDDAYALLCRVVETKLHELPEAVAARRRLKLADRVCFGLYLAGWVALVVGLAFRFLAF